MAVLCRLRHRDTTGHGLLHTYVGSRHFNSLLVYSRYRFPLEYCQVSIPSCYVAREQLPRGTLSGTIPSWYIARYRFPSAILSGNDSLIVFGVCYVRMCVYVYVFARTCLCLSVMAGFWLTRVRTMTQFYKISITSTAYLNK